MCTLVRSGSISSQGAMNVKDLDLLSVFARQENVPLVRPMSPTGTATARTPPIAPTARNTGLGMNPQHVLIAVAAMRFLESVIPVETPRLHATPVAV